MFTLVIKSAVKAIVRKIRRSFFLSKSAIAKADYDVSWGMLSQNIDTLEKGLKAGGAVRNHHLTKAIRLQRLEQLALLLHYGADSLNKGEEHMSPPLIMAAYTKERIYYDLLVKYGANPYVKNFRGKKPSDIRKETDFLISNGIRFPK